MPRRSGCVRVFEFAYMSRPVSPGRRCPGRWRFRRLASTLGTTTGSGDPNMSLRPRLSYANVVATLALVLAASGGAYAATQLPRNSVGSRQIRKNAVTSSKIKNGSLLPQDFKAGQLPAGAPGLPGQQGQQGIQGVKGDKGDRGPSDAYNRTDIYTIDNLPAGSYEIVGKLGFTGGTSGTSLLCDLNATPTSGGLPTL